MKFLTRSSNIQNIKYNNYGDFGNISKKEIILDYIHLEKYITVQARVQDGKPQNNEKNNDILSGYTQNTKKKWK